MDRTHNASYLHDDYRLVGCFEHSDDMTQSPLSKEKIMTVGEEIIEGLTELVAVIKSGEPIEDHFTVVTLRIDKAQRDIRIEE